MRRVIPWLIMIFLGLGGAAFAGEIADREKIWNGTKAAFRAGDFEGLDRVALDYLKSGARTSGGSWKHSLFHQTFNSAEFLYGGGDLASLDEADAQASRWIEARPASATAKLAKVSLMWQRAMFYRGTGYLHTLSAKEMRQFLDEASLAYQQLTAVRAEASSDPRWHELLLEMLLYVGSRNRFEIAAGEALQTFPTYTPNAFIIARQSLPQWGGTFRSMEGYAYTVAASAEEASEEGDEVYARFYWSIADSLEYNIFDRTRVNWPRMKQGFEDILRRYPDNFNLNSYFRFSCLARDKETTKRLSEQVGLTIELSIWEKDTVLLLHCRGAHSAPLPEPTPASPEYEIAPSAGPEGKA